MAKILYIANMYRSSKDDALLNRVRDIIHTEPILVDALGDYPYKVSSDNYIYPIEVDRYCVALHIYSTYRYIKFYQALKRIVKNNSDLFKGFKFSYQYSKIYLFLTDTYRE